LENRNLHAHRATLLHAYKFQAAVPRLYTAKGFDQSSSSLKVLHLQKQCLAPAFQIYISGYAKRNRLFSQEELLPAPFCFHFHPKLFTLKTNGKDTIKRL
jgi:hypothetical protein